MFSYSVEGAEQKQTACYDIDVEVDDTLKTQMNNFLLSTTSQQEIQASVLLKLFILPNFDFFISKPMLTIIFFQNLDNKIHETVESINTLKTNREFFLSFAKDPQQFINKWLISQTRDLKVMEWIVLTT